jgi:XTP/dITP diphosphohydrolase
MNRMILASSNAHKLEEIMQITKEFGIELVTMSDAGLVDFDIEENGDTFEANSMIKAKAVVDELGEAAVADDSGLMVDYLGGAPGIYSARYSGEDKNYDANNKKLLKELAGVPLEKRTARFVSVITLLTPEGRSLVVRGEIEGVIAESENGSNGFGYDPLFYIPSKDKTFAELTSDEKNEISHRANALVKLKNELKEFLK